MLTSHQAGMVVRQAKSLRKTANARAKWLSEHHTKLAEACSGKLGKVSAEISKLEAQLANPAPMAKPVLRKKLAKQVAKKRKAAESTKGRQGRLLASALVHKKIAESGLASQVFGGAKLASQVHRLDEESSPFKGKSTWDQAWTESRDQAWLFEGDKSAASANSNAKMDIDTGVLRLRLTDRQALEKMKERAGHLGVDPKLLSGDSLAYSSDRMACRFLALKLDLRGQPGRLAGLRLALTPSADPKYKGKTPPCDQSVSWRLWIEGNVSKPETCKVYARAMWKTPEVPLVTFGSNGCLGVDVNAWGVALAWCNAEGNKPSKGVKYRSNIVIDWTGSSEHALHEIRIAAKSIVDGAAALGCPLALEALDFSDLKRRLRYEGTREQAKRLSSFAYGKLQEAIIARAAKVGVEIRWVDPSWTSVVGWAKYGAEWGLNPDQAAAFCIARRGGLSKNHLRRAKTQGKWVDLHARPEKLDGLQSKAGLAVSKSLDALEAKKEDQATVTLPKKVSGTKKPPASSRQQSMPSGPLSAERRLALALGSDRRAWPTRLSLAAGKHTQVGRSRSRMSSGKADRGGETSLPAESLGPSIRLLQQIR